LQIICLSPDKFQKFKSPILKFVETRALFLILINPDAGKYYQLTIESEFDGPEIFINLRGLSDGKRKPENPAGSRINDGPDLAASAASPACHDETSREIRLSFQGFSQSCFEGACIPRQKKSSILSAMDCFYRIVFELRNSILRYAQMATATKQ
jgi:hypothetical protein